MSKVSEYRSRKVRAMGRRTAQPEPRLRPFTRAWLGAIAAAFLLARAIGAPEPAAAQAPARPPAPGFPAANAKPPKPVALEEAVARGIATAFRDIAADGKRIEIVIDPLLDGVTGGQTIASRQIDARVVEELAKQYPGVTVLPFSEENVAKAAFVLIGTFNPINNAGQPEGPRDAYWICFALIDKAKGTVAARSVGRVEPAGVDATPAPVFAASPVWVVDEATAAYIRACQRSQPGDPVDRVYLDRLALRAQTRDAQNDFEGGRTDVAAVKFQRASQIPGGETSTDVLNGLFLGHMKAGRTAAANEVLRQLAELGLKEKRLGVKLLFETGTTRFVSDPAVSGAYPQWVSEIASAAAQSRLCLEVVGHASRTGSAPWNLRLSLQRARFVAQELERTNPALTRRVGARGVGSREVLVGLPVDDARTALDRRVEFRPKACELAGLASGGSS